MRRCALALLTLACFAGSSPAQRSKPLSERQRIDLILSVTEPLPQARGGRQPFYHWHLTGPGSDNDDEARGLLRQLDARGFAVLGTWTPNNRDAALAKALRLARLQHELGMTVAINANACSYGFFNGDAATAHVDAEGQPFFDDSFGGSRKMGCPFALAQRVEPMKEALTWYLDRYKQAGLDVDFLFYDWEIDGPLEWNGAWAASRRCTRCRQHLPGLDDFATFQDRLRALRADLQRQVLAEPVLQRFPKALVGNYAVYPNDGWRYWYDYFEQPPGRDTAYRMDGRCPVRRWTDEWQRSGFTFAMPVVYTWWQTPNWYDFEPYDYRWMYNLLKVGSNAGEHTPANVPLITFIHWHTTAQPADQPPVTQFTERGYTELLWHLLLRGHDAFFIWCPNTEEEISLETKLAHAVYRESMRYSEFFGRGTPVTYLVPQTPSVVVSGMRLGDQVLVRRTDYGDSTAPVPLRVGDQVVQVPRLDGACQVLAVK